MIVTRKAKSECAFHVVKVPLVVAPSQARIIDQRLLVLGKLRNAVLSVLVARANAMRGNERFREYAALPGGDERSTGFRELRDEYGLSRNAARTLALEVLRASKWMPDHVPAQTAQTEAAQVYAAVNEWLVGRRGRPRPKPSAECDVMWGAGPDSVVRFDAAASELVMGGRLKRKNLCLETTRSAKWLGRWINSGRVMGAAVQREVVRDRTRYFALIRVEGEPYRSPQYLSTVASGVVGLDAGPSRLAVVGDNEAYFIDRAPAELLQKRHAEQTRARRAQRALDRSLRATNPECFDSKGRRIRGREATARSKAYERKQRKLASEQRRARINRRGDETQLARRVMRSGNVVAVEDVNYASWQASFYGRRMCFTAPGALMDRVKHEARVTGGRVVELPLRLALSQHCVCGHRQKKGLGERVHACPTCGVVADRDLFSAWLCKLIVEGGLDPLTTDLSRGPLLAAANGLRPASAGDGLTPREIRSTKPTLVGSSANAHPRPGNTLHGSSVDGTPGNGDAQQTASPELRGLLVT